MKHIQIHLSFKSRWELFHIKYFESNLWKWDLIIHGRWYTFKILLKDIKSLIFGHKKIGALFG